MGQPGVLVTVTFYRESEYLASRMQIPFRLALAGQGRVDAGLVGAIAISTAVFSATPLILNSVIEAFELGSTAAGLVSGCQLAGFVLTSFLAGRVTHPSRQIFTGAIILLSMANAASAMVNGLPLLLVLRFVAGLALGLLTWLAWSSAFGDNKKMGSVAVIGPIAGVVVSPLVGVLVELSSFRAVFVGLAIFGLLPLLGVAEFARPIEQDSHRSSGGAPVAFLVIGCLALVAFSGSAVFVFSGVIAENDLGISPWVFSLVMSANAAAGIPSAGWSGARPLAGLWLAGCGTMAIIFTTSGNAYLGAAAIIAWGFAFWMGIPGVYSLLSRVSRYPAERAGDAQAAMAVGRIFGPVVGGSLLGIGSQATLGLLAGGLLILSGVTLAAADVATGSSS